MNACDRSAAVVGVVDEAVAVAEAATTAAAVVVVVGSSFCNKPFEFVLRIEYSFCHLSAQRPQPDTND